MENARQRRLTRGKWTAFAVLALGQTILGADKLPATCALQRFLSRGQTSPVTSNDVARGWRAVAFPGTEPPVEMPAGAMTNDLLRRRGGCDWAFRVEPDGWRFPYRDGRFAWRTDGGSTSYLPVLPFDWDNDGLENSVDPEPLVPNPVDAHGTPAEWYRIVCFNVFTTADNSNNQTFLNSNIPTFPNSNIPTFPNSDISFRTNANPRAYYFVDAVASEGPAPIYFSADRGSRLGSPVVVARAGETNRVPLLVGVGYAVASAVPFSVAPLEGSFAEVDRRDARSCAIRWPLDFMVTESDDGHTVTVTPVPYDPGGIYVWNDQNDASRDVAGLLSARPSDCPYVANGGCLMFGCGGGYCTCGGCWRSGSLMLDGASFRLPTIWCGCGDDGPEDPEPTPVPHRDMASRPAVSVSFSHPVVLFENAYTNAPGEIVQRQSTETTLTISAYGGANGAFLEVDPGMLEERLERREGHRLPPTRVKIPANSDVVYSVTYQGRAASERKGDVEVTAALTAVNEMSPMPSTAEMTAVQVAIIPERPMGDLYRSRHRFGICEKVWCNIAPTDLIVSWSSGQQGSMAVDGHYFKHHVPFAAQSYELTAEIEGVRLSCPVSSIFPSGVSAFNDPNYEIYAIVNQAAIDDAGWVGFEVSVYCAPTNVYFGNIEVREEPTPASSFTNYFSSSYWSGRRDHQGTAISLDWVSPKVENYMCEDQVSIDACPPPWLDGGTLVWRIPNVCRHSVDGVCQEHRYAYTEQSFSISSNGIVEVSKFGIHAMRAPGQTMSLRIDDGK